MHLQYPFAVDPRDASGLTIDKVQMDLLVCSPSIRKVGQYSINVLCGWSQEVHDIKARLRCPGGHEHLDRYSHSALAPVLHYATVVL